MRAALVLLLLPFSVSAQTLDEEIAASNSNTVITAPRAPGAEDADAITIPTTTELAKGATPEVQRALGIGDTTQEVPVERVTIDALGGAVIVQHQGAE
ncbi:MAG: hypothetical protein ACU0DW_01205 [Shimia sp.]